VGIEDCDDGNQDDTDACRNTCEVARCGDGVTRAGVEGCDDGNGVETDACRSDCTAARCGAGVVQQDVEACDDANQVETDACLGNCAVARCGDNTIQADVEICDDGNLVQSDACLNNCTAASCGDGHLRAGVEACDDGNQVQTDTCLNTCVAASCGDQHVQAGVEACDDNNQVQTDACLNTCVAASCGDSHVQAGVEGCDDGNRVDNDACDNNCRQTNTGETQAAAGVSCKVIRQEHPQLGSGLRWVDPDGGDNGNAERVYCDMVTDSGGWMLLANRIPFSDSTGMADLDAASGNTDPARTNNFNLDARVYYPAATEVIFAAAFGGARCASSDITCYAEVLRVALNANQNKTYSSTCTGNPTGRSSRKLRGTNANNDQTAYLCADSLGWGNCNNQLCHFGSHGISTEGDGVWSQNGTAEMHVPSTRSNYDDHSYCRSCYGGRANVCCNSGESGQNPVFTLWLR
jgi:cysteine-rich repeat protein